MKRLLVILFLIPSLAFGAYTEFYCQNGGSNTNAGSTTSNTPIYTKTHGNWTQSTAVFTVQDGTNPSSSVTVGDWCAVMVDGGTIAACVGRVTAVQNANNGTITLGAGIIGTKPANQTGTATITDGGAWQGPNGASGFPVTLTSFGNNMDSSSHVVRLNLKNDQTYTVTASFAPVVIGSGTYTVQGYSSSVNDGGRATFDGTTSTNVIMSAAPTGTSWIDLIFKTSFASSSSDLVTVSNQSSFLRCVFTGSRGHGLNISSVSTKVIECEFYGNNTSNTSGKAAAATTGPTQFTRCVFHDNTGSNTIGILVGSNSGVTINQCIFDTNGGIGVSFTGLSSVDFQSIYNSDFYNNGSDAISFPSNSAAQIWIENCNFIKNTGAGINNASTTLVRGFVYNCGYGAGTQANGSADTLNNLYQAGTVTYASNVTPWVDPANGDFRINLDTAEGAGRGAFTQTATSYTGSVGYPDIGAVQAQIGTAFPTPTATATATPTPTATATATATVTPTVTPTPTAPIEQSYVYPN